MVKSRAIVMILLLSALVILGAACSGNESSSQLSGAKEERSPAAMEQKGQDQAAAMKENQPDGESAKMAQQNADAEKTGTIQLTGMVERGDNGIIIVTDQGKYNVTGQDLSEMVGKTVNVTGAVEESAGQYTINVTSFEESH